MNDQTFSRSKSLNNIPYSKLSIKTSLITDKCEICCKKEIKPGKSLEVGLCPKCRVLITAYNRYYEANIPVEYWDLKMEKDFVGYPGLLTKYNEYTNDLKTSYLNGTSICFAGNCGVGKTMTSTCILKKACQKGYNCLYSDLSSVVSILTSAPHEEKFFARKELVMVDFLFLDETDNRFFNNSEAANEMFSKTLEGIIRSRLQNKLPILIATNSPNIKESFTALFKTSLNSLMNKITFYSVLGDDFRKNK